MTEYIRNLKSFIEKNPCSYHITASQVKTLRENGYSELKEADDWDLKPGCGYFVTRNDSALMAFKLPAGDIRGFRIMASHNDSPALKLKENPNVDAEGKYTKLNVEAYGGSILSTWFDRPLSVAGRLIVKTEEGLRTVLVNIEEDLLMIPSLAIHLDRNVNDGHKISVQKEMLPVYSLGKAEGILERLAESAGVSQEDILGHDLMVYNRQVPSVWGSEKEFFSAPRIDDCACVYASLCAFLAANRKHENSYVTVHAVFDNEEVGSSTRQGAASTFLDMTLQGICSALGYDGSKYRKMLAQSFMLSADNGHALHPNYPEKCDPVNRTVPGKGILLKYSANQKYTTDGYSAAMTRNLASKAGVELQVFSNNSDIPGGSTLGNISGNQVAIPAADVGLAQLAMHSSFETCSTKDPEDLEKLAEALFADC